MTGTKIWFGDITITTSCSPTPKRSSPNASRLTHDRACRGDKLLVVFDASIHTGSFETGRSFGNMYDNKSVLGMSRLGNGEEIVILAIELLFSE